MRFYFTCPSCKCDEGFTTLHEESSSLGCLIFLFGGFIPALLFASYRSNRIQCDNCGYVFRQPAIPKTRVAKLATTFLFFIIVAIVIAILLPNFSNTAGSVQNPAVAPDFIQLIEDHPDAFVLLIASILLCLFASIVSSIVLRIRLSKEFRLHPKHWSSPIERKRKDPKRKDPKRISTEDCKQSPETNSTKDADDLTGNAQE